MNRAEKRRQKKIAEKAARNAKGGDEPIRPSGEQAPDTQQTLNQAVQHHTAGRLPEAEAIYRQVLQSIPDQPDALHLLGVIAHQTGRGIEAVDLITRAIAARPGFLEAHNNLGNVLQELGRLDEAVANYRKAISLKPDFAQAHNNLGNTLRCLGQCDEAAGSLLKALELNPEYAQAHCNLGNVFRDQGRLEDAIASYTKAREINLNLAEAHINLGLALQDLGKPDEAVAAFQKAISINPENAEVHNNLGLALLDSGKLEEALPSLQRAIDINPDYAEAHYNMGNALQVLGKMGGAADNYQRALTIKPDYAEANNNLGNALKKQGKLDEAVDHFHKALALKPDYADAHNNLGNAFMGLGRFDEALDSFRKAITLKPDYADAGRNLLLALLNIPGLTAKELFDEHVRFSETHSQNIVRPSEDLTNDPDPGRRLRIGYLSSDLRDLHPVGRNVYPLISCHDRTKVEVFCYADVPRPDAMTERFRSNVDHWRSITGKPDADVAGMVRADGIDVLVCLAGHFDKNRPLVCAYRAAPVQVSFHDGATSGLEDMDFWLTDEFLHPADTREMFTEELYRLPVFYQYPPFTEAPAVDTLPADQEGFITFGSFNNPAKINDEVINLWAEILNSVPGSRILFKYNNWYDQPTLRDRMLEQFTASGVGRDRVLFEGSDDTLADHLGRYNAIDIALDPFPFNGATTTFQALWMGVPVISLAGETFISRAAGSLLVQVGLEECVADTPEAYVALARDLAGDLDRLKSMRASLREQVSGSPLCNAPAYARSVEDAYRDMWRIWCGRQ